MVLFSASPSLSLLLLDFLLSPINSTKNLKSIFSKKLELERVPDPAQRPGPEEKLAVNKLNTRYYPGPNLIQAHELLSRLDRARDRVVNTRLE